MGTKYNDFCAKCPQKDGCKAVYERLGHSEGPSVVGRVCWAFLLPIVLFIAVLLGLDHLLPPFAAEKWRTLTVFGLSIAVTLLAMWAIKTAAHLEKTCRGK